MRFAFSDDQLLLQSTVRDFLKKECTPEVVRALWASESGHDAVLWSRLAELGVPGALVPDAHGGMGLDERDLVLLLEEAGRAALPAPVVATAAVGAPLLRDAGRRPDDPEGQALRALRLADAWLPRVAAGDAILAVGLPANPFVTDAGVADLLLLAHGDEVHAVERSATTLTHQLANDPARRLFSVAWTPSAATRIASGDAARSLIDAAFDRGALACAAQAIGVADQLLAIAVGFAGQRQQFGRPIGSFQALQHRLADAKVKLEYARPVVYKAAHSVATGAAQRAVDVSHAKIAATEAAAFAARVALQVHGAIGYTWEQDLHIWMRRAWSFEREFGDAAFHLDRVSAFVLADGAPIGPGNTFLDFPTGG
jgi:alkylation response protein AidB-like acyl-CoA dehydrogenase